eukprot:775775-Pleurochrysis_carterae.AAC.1
MTRPERAERWARASTPFACEFSLFQERLYLRDPNKVKLRKRYVCGLREVSRSLKTNKARAIIVAHNIERIESEAGLDDMVRQLLELCEKKQEWVYDDAEKRSTQQLVPREKHVPVIFALTRKQLSRALKRSAKTSVVSVLSFDGAEEHFQVLMKEAELAREGWRRRVAPWLTSSSESGTAATVGKLGARQAERQLVMHKIGTRVVPVDPLLLHAGPPVDEDEDAVEKWLQES